MKSYLTVQNDRLDRIARRLYGTEHTGNVEALLDANPGLADYGIYLPAGVTIIVPLRSQQPVQQTNIIQLWD